MKKQDKKHNASPLDVWPPPPKKKDEKKRDPLLPRNKSYVDRFKELESSVADPVFEAEELPPEQPSEDTPNERES